MGFILTTDTSCDVFKTELDEKGIPWIPLTFTIKDETFEDNFSSDAEYTSFYNKLSEGAMPTTSQINMFAHEEFFEKLLSGGSSQIVHLTLSGGLSNTVSSAKIAAENVMKKIPGTKIYIVDTLSATQGHHLLLDEALKLRDSGATGKECAQELDKCAAKIHHWFMVDDLHHLRRGGRVSGASAVIGTLLNIKPVLIINREGKLAVVKKAKGAAGAANYFMEMIEHHKADLKNGSFYIVQGNAHKAAALLKERIQETYPDCSVHTGWVGPVIGAHTGSGIFGVVFIGKERLTNQ